MKDDHLLIQEEPFCGTNKNDLMAMDLVCGAKASK